MSASLGFIYYVANFCRVGDIHASNATYYIIYQHTKRQKVTNLQDTVDTGPASSCFVHVPLTRALRGLRSPTGFAFRISAQGHLSQQPGRDGKLKGKNKNKKTCFIPLWLYAFQTFAFSLVGVASSSNRGPRS